MISFIQLCIIVDVMPFEENRMNYIEILNESTILLTSYLLLLLMNVDFDFDISDYVGYMMISIFLINFIANVILIMIDRIRLAKVIIKSIVKKVKERIKKDKVTKI